MNLLGYYAFKSKPLNRSSYFVAKSYREYIYTFYSENSTVPEA